MPFTLQRLKDSLPLQNMATTDRQMLLFCIGLAFVFWLILNLSQDYEVNKEVNIEYLVSPERVVEGDPPRTVSVQLRGRGWNLIWESLRGRALNVVVDVEDNPSLLLTTNLLQQKISRELSSGDLEIDNLGYEAQRVVTTEREGKLVPVVPRINMDFAPGYFAAEGMQVSPDSVRVSGTPEELESVVDWPTEPVELTKLEEDTEITVGLRAPPEGLSLNYAAVRVGVGVEAFIEQQIEVPVRLRNAPPSDSSRVFPTTVTVTVTIPESEYGKLTESSFRVEADLDQLQISGDHNTLPLSLTRVPTSAKSVNFSPRAVEYYVYRREQR